MLLASRAGIIRYDHVELNAFDFPMLYWARIFELIFSRFYRPLADKPAYQKYAKWRCMSRMVGIQNLTFALTPHCRGGGRMPKPSGGKMARFGSISSLSAVAVRPVPDDQLRIVSSSNTLFT